MSENSTAYADTGCLCRRHELLLTQGQDLSADNTGNADPADDTHDNTQHVDTCLCRSLVVIHDRTEDQIQRDRRDTVNDINHTHQEGGHPSAEKSCDTTYNDTDDKLNDNYDKSDHKGNSSAVHQTCQKIHSVAVRSAPVLYRRCRITVDDLSCPLERRCQHDTAGDRIHAHIRNIGIVCALRRMNHGSAALVFNCIVHTIRLNSLIAVCDRGQHLAVKIIRKCCAFIESRHRLRQAIPSSVVVYSVSFTPDASNTYSTPL